MPAPLLAVSPLAVPGSMRPTKRVGDCSRDPPEIRKIWHPSKKTLEVPLFNDKAKFPECDISMNFS